MLVKHALSISIFVSIAAMHIPVLIIQGCWLPKSGINGWTGEPEDKYYELRDWKRE